MLWPLLLALTALLRPPAHCGPVLDGRAVQACMSGARRIATVSVADMPVAAGHADHGRITLGSFALSAFFKDGDAAAVEEASMARRLLLNGHVVDWNSLGDALRPGDTVEVVDVAPDRNEDEPSQPPESCASPRLGCLKGRRGSRSRSGPTMSTAHHRRRGVVLSWAWTGAAAALLLPTRSLADSSNRFTTVTTAKRRYYARVKQGVFEFLELGAAVTGGDLHGAAVSGFFAPSLQTRAAGTRTRCAGGGGDACAVAQRLSSRWDDMQTAMLLLGNAFRTSGGTAPPPPDKVRQVREARAFAAQVERLRRAAAAGDGRAATVAYAAACEALSLFLNDVDLPPLADAEYRAAQADTQAASLCQGSFCV